MICNFELATQIRMEWIWFWIVVTKISLLKVLSAGGPTFDEIIERFEYQQETGNQQIIDPEATLEFLVIARPVSWTEAEVLCPSYVKEKFTRHLPDWETDYDVEDENKNVSNLSVNGVQGSNGHLATIGDGNLAKWLARMLAESNYRYDGLWIGGQRKRDNGTWTWIGVQEHEKSVIPQRSKSGYPPWFKSRNYLNKNCLIFDKQGHDMPLFLEEHCHRRRPFICQRISRRSIRDLLKEGQSITVDGQQYTLYHFSDEEKQNEIHNHKAIKRLNGGGVKWRDALMECHRRGQELAVVPSKEAAVAIADIMLKSRPSMESAWLGGWSPDGFEWTWVSSGASLPFVKSSLTGYPPWPKDYPHVLSAEPRSVKDYFEKKTKCLILDRHLCPLHMNPVFLDLDCEKRRPFVCQTVQLEHLRDGDAELKEKFMVNGYAMKFSERKMTWEEGKTYCEEMGTTMAKINESETLDGVLEQMTALSLDHTWIGGRTLQMMNGDWKWFDVHGENALESDRQDWWCMGEENHEFPDAKPDLCLNLDREGRGLPLFYGLRCNETRQHVLCAWEDNRNGKERNLGNKTDCSRLSPPSVENGSWICNPKSEDLVCRLQCGLGLSPIPLFLNPCAEARVGRQIGCLSLRELTVTIKRRLTQIVEANSKLGFLFVLDDSMSVLNAWFVEQLKLVTIIIQTVFRLSADHPMGLITFSSEAKEAIPMNETEECHALLRLTEQVFVSRGVDWNYRLENGTSRGTTDIINAVKQVSRVQNYSQMSRNLVLFITDGEHTEDESDMIEKKETAVKELKRLRDLGHEVLALLITQGTEKEPDYKLMQELFPDSSNGESNLFALENYQNLADLVSTLNETRTKPYPTICEQPQWIVPEDHPLLAHLLQKK